MGKRSPAPPPAPDYATLAIKQGEANLAAAKQSAYMSNPNIYTPTGTQTVTWTKTPQVDTDAYQKALQSYYDRMAEFGPDAGGVEPTQEQFTTFIEQPTVRQTVSAETEAALRAQERAQLSMSQAAAGAAAGLGNLGIASAFNAGNLPGIDYTIGYAGPAQRELAAPGEGPGYTSQPYAETGINFGPTAAYAPSAFYGIEGLPGQIGTGAQAAGGPAAPTLQGFQYGGPQVTQAPTGGLFGMAGAGPQGLQLGGVDLTGVGGVAGGPGQGQFGYAQRFVQGPQLQGQIDVSDLPQGPINAGMTAQQAILSRLSPQLMGERQQLQTQLINQGLRPGGEAYNAAIAAQAQKENDLLLQAAAQGISLDQAARQQAFAEQQSRAMFANQAALSGFGAGMEQAGLYNVGAQQDLQSALATQAAQNQAQQQAFQQRLQAGEFGREAQLASFGTQQQAQEMANQAVAQNFQQALASQQAQNAAQAQAYQQALAGQGFNREALMAQFGMGQQAQELANAAAAQNFAQQAQAQELNLARQAQQTGQSQEQAQFYNQAQAQAMQQEVARAALQNQAQAQRFNQILAQQAQRNAAIGQRFDIDAQRAAFQNAAQQQQFQQNIAQQQFRNTAIQQALAQQAAIRSIPVNEISALLSGGQVSVPQFQGYSGVTVAPAPIFQGGQAQDAAAMQRYGIQANQAASNASGLFGALGNLGSAAITAGMFSDRRLKSNIVRVGTHPLGIGIYEYDIFGERQRGVMADEVENVRPEAVSTHASGYKMVNYGAL
jgi:hypothetical protein